MKRRAFIGLLGASALSMPFILNENGLGSARRNNRISASNKIPLRLKLPKDVAEICGQLGKASRRVYLTGGTAIAAAAGVESPYINLLVNTPKFTELKNSLFQFGVTPVSTADLPGNFARFMYQDKAFNVLNMSFDTYTLLNVTGQEHGLILFAHNFLMYNVKDSSMIDPYDALKAKSADGKNFLMMPIQQPKTLLHGFEHCLAATFDSALLGLQPSPEFAAMEDRVFNSIPTAEDSKEIMGKMLDYMSDILEVGGWNTASKLMRSPVCVAAAKDAAAIDLTKIEASLRRLQKQGAEISGREFMSSVHAELKKKTSGKGSAQGLPEYLAIARDPFRRVEVLRDAMESKPA
jgi:hypothetical protein